MKTPVITCLAPSVKKVILEHCGLKERAGLQVAMSKVPNCTGGHAAQVASGGSRDTGGRKKRAPSPYNSYIGKCMKQGKNMKTCATEYKSDQGAKLYRKLF